MYARSYDTHPSEENIHALPCGYSGNAFENTPPAPLKEPTAPNACEACTAKEERTAEAGIFASLRGRIPLLDKIKIPALQRLSFDTLFSDTEDFLLIGLFLLLLFSKEGDPLCAVAVAILFFSGKI